MMTNYPIPKAVEGSRKGMRKYVLDNALKAMSELIGEGEAVLHLLNRLSFDRNQWGVDGGACGCVWRHSCGASLPYDVVVVVTLGELVYARQSNMCDMCSVQQSTIGVRQIMRLTFCRPGSRAI